MFLNTGIASLAGSRLTRGELFYRLHVTGRLASLVQAALAQQWLRDQVLTAGLSVSIEERQHAADVCWRLRGQLTADDAHAWLATQGLSVEDFEAGLLETLLADKLRKQLTGTETKGNHDQNYHILYLLN